MNSMRLFLEIGDTNAKTRRRRKRRSSRKCK
jgi:hypothetical protein